MRSHASEIECLGLTRYRDWQGGYSPSTPHFLPVIGDETRDVVECIQFAREFSILLINFPTPKSQICFNSFSTEPSRLVIAYCSDL